MTAAANPVRARAPGEPRVNGTAWVLARIGFHGVVLLALPFLVGGLTAMVADVSQVGETLTGLARFAGALLMPVLLVQVTSIVVKVRRERAALAAAGDIPPGAIVRALDRHVRVMTDKGLGLLLCGLLAVVLSLAFRFAELGMIAVLGLSTLYLVVAVGTVLSTFVVARFEDRLATRGGSIGREFVPVLSESGTPWKNASTWSVCPSPRGSPCGSTRNSRPGWKPRVAMWWVPMYPVRESPCRGPSVGRRAGTTPSARRRSRTPTCSDLPAWHLHSLRAHG